MKRTLLTVAVLTLAGVALYAIAGFWIAPRILERKLQATVRENTDLDLGVEATALNPFTLALSLDNVTLFRPGNPPVVSVGRLEGRIGGIDFSEESLSLRDVGLRSLEIVDREHRPFLSVPAATAETFVVGSRRGPLSIEAPRFLGPQLSLHRGPDGAFGPARELSLLLRVPSSVGDHDVKLQVSDGRLAYIDQHPSTPLRLEVEDIDGAIGWKPAAEDVVATASLRGRMHDNGTASLTAAWHPARPRNAARLELELQRFDLPLISPYVAAIVDRAVLAGRIDLDMDLSIEASTLQLGADIAVDDLRLGHRTQDADQPALPVEVAVALLEDVDSRIALHIPGIRRPFTGSAGVAAGFSAALKKYLNSLTSAPFRYLAGVVGRPGMDLGRIPFPPGSAEIRDAAVTRLAALNGALGMRPRLALTVFPALNEVTDRDALARQEILLHVNLASSAGLPGEPVPASVDFEDPIVRDVLDEFAANRLPQSRRAALAQRNPQRDVVYYRAVFDALVDNEDVSLSSLARLARYRAQAVAEALADGEDDSDRVRPAEEILLAPTAASTAEVTLEVRAME